MAEISGSNQADDLAGTSAADVIFGLGGSDTLFGGGGADSLYGGSGDDLLDGGAGDDLLDGGAGVDTARYGIATAMDVWLGGGTVAFLGVAWADESLVAIENFIAGSGNDSVRGSDGANAIWGGAGDDRIWGLGGSDTLDGGAGSDTIVGGSALYIDPTHPFDERDTVRYDWATTAVVADLSFGTAAVDGNGTDALYGIGNIWGGTGRDVLTGDEGANELRGGGGGDSLAGGSGNDTLWGQGGTDALNGGAGSDTAVYADNTTAVRVDLAAGLVTFSGQSWPEETLVSIENAVGGSAADTLLGSAAANVLEGGGGADRIDGRGGSDTVSFAGEAQAVVVNLVTLRAGAIGSSVRDTLVSIENARGGVGNDRIVGNSGANVLDGGNGADTLTGAGGNDTLVLSSGFDRLDGGAGTDTLVIDQTYEHYGNGSRGGGFGDIGEYYWFFSGPTAMTLRIDLTGTSTLHYGGTGSSSLSGIENVTTGVGNDHVYGSSGANVISVDHGANYVDARGGNDTVYGSNVVLLDHVANDYSLDERDIDEVIRGGGGNDRIVGASHAFGDAGNDTIVAGWLSGQEMTGGAGADRFEFSGYVETDFYHGVWSIMQDGRILDFDPSEGDRIVIDRVNDSAPAPEFVGSVASVLDLEVGQYGLAGERLFYVVEAGVDETWGDRYVFGPSVDLVGFTGTLTADDVLFV